MSSQLSQSDRLLCVDTIKHNVKHLPNHLIEPVTQMIEEGSKDYCESNLTTTGNTFDRHPYSPYGNALEVAVAAHHCVGGGERVDLCTSFESQCVRKLDLITDVGSLQIKRTLRGGYGELFIGEDELQGDADYLCFVDGEIGKVIYIDRRAFLQYKKDNEWVREEWRTIPRSKGWYISAYMSESVSWYREEDIHPDVHVPYRDNKTKQMKTYQLDA